jgi:alpha-L-fucosidase
METGFSMFVHYGVNTYTPASEHNCVKRGETCVDAKVFHPTALDTDQWAQTAVDMGAYAMCLTAKHEGGFALWPSKRTNYSVLASPARVDVVAAFVKSCRKFKLQPCFYESPVENGYAMNSGASPPDADAFIDQELAFYDELLGGTYGHIERVWWDHYPGGCSGLAACPNNSFPQGYRRIIDHIRRISPTTLISNGPDAQWVGNTKGTGTYPVWNACDLDPTKSAPFCNTSSWGPGGGTWMPRMEGYTIQKGGDWFWHHGLAPLNATEIWQHWKLSVGRGTHLLLNVPPNSTGLIPDTYRAELAAFGSALKATLAQATQVSGGVGEIASVANVSAACSSGGAGGASFNAVVLALPAAGVLVDMVQLRESVGRFGQRVPEYVLEVQAEVDGQWSQLSGAEVHGETIGHRVVDLFDGVKSTGVRWRWPCQSQQGQQAQQGVATAHLASFSVHRRHPALRTGADFRADRGGAVS